MSSTAAGPHRCHMCPQRFFKRDNRERHEERRHPAFRFRCGDCGLKYRKREELRKHQGRRHPGYAEATAARRLLSVGPEETMPTSPTLSTLAMPLACSPLEAAEAGEEAMLPQAEEEEVAVEEGAREEVASVPETSDAPDEPLHIVEDGVPEQVAMEEDAQEELAVEEDVPEVLEDEVPVGAETSSVAGEVASVPVKADAPDEPLRIEEKTQLDFHRYLVEREEVVEEFEEGKLKSRKRTIYRYKLL